MDNDIMGKSIRAFFLAAALGISFAASRTNVVTTTEDLAALAREVGGNRVSIDSIARGYQDPHFVEPKPSFLLKLQKADLLAVVGLQLEIGWLPPLMTQSRNSRIQIGTPGYLDLSNACSILEIPTGPFERRIQLPAGAKVQLGRKILEKGLLLLELRKLS